MTSMAMFLDSNGHIIDKNNTMVLEYALFGVWVDKGQGTCE